MTQNIMLAKNALNAIMLPAQPKIAQIGIFGEIAENVVNIDTD